MFSAVYSIIRNNQRYVASILTPANVVFASFCSMFCLTPSFCPIPPGRLGRDRMMVDITTSYVISAYHH